MDAVILKNEYALDCLSALNMVFMLSKKDVETNKHIINNRKFIMPNGNSEKFDRIYITIEENAKAEIRIKNDVEKYTSSLLSFLYKEKNLRFEKLSHAYANIPKIPIVIVINEKSPYSSGVNILVYINNAAKP